MLLILPLNLFALLIYLASRPHGTLIRCEACGNPRLPYVGVCPHCRHMVRARSMTPDVANPCSPDGRPFVLFFANVGVTWPWRRIVFRVTGGIVTAPARQLVSR